MRCSELPWRLRASVDLTHEGPWSLEGPGGSEGLLGYPLDGRRHGDWVDLWDSRADLWILRAGPRWLPLEVQPCPLDCLGTLMAPSGHHQRSQCACRCSRTQWHLEMPMPSHS